MGIKFGKIQSKLLELEIESLGDLYETIEYHLIQEKEEIINRQVDLEFAESPASNLDDVSNYLGEKYQIMNVEFPNRIRYTLIIHCYTLLEVYLKKYCKLLCYRKNLVSELEEIKQKATIDKLQQIIKRNLNLDWNRFNPEWQIISNVKQLRNCLVHQTGEVLFNIRNKNFIMFIKANSSLSVINYDKFVAEINRRNVENDWGSDGPDTYKIYIDDNELSKEFCRSLKSFFKKLYGVDIE